MGSSSRHGICGYGAVADLPEWGIQSVFVMAIWLQAGAALAVSGIVLRIWYRHWRAKKIAAARRVERPISSYSSGGVRNQVDRERWGGITLPGLHPLNQEEVHRLLVIVDADGIHALSSRDRLFLDNMTVSRPSY